MKAFILVILLIVLPPSAFAEKNTGITLSHNYQKPGGDYSNYYVKDVEECSKRCLQEQRCKAFDFHTSDNSCWLKDTSYPARKYQGCISGLKQFAPDIKLKQNSSQVESVQKLLDKYNYNPGPADGLLGKKTELALKNYQKAHNLPVTGQIDEATLIAMKLIKPTKAKE